MTTPKPREPLIGWMIFEEYCDDYSEWSGVITYPDPTGANLAWQDPVKMIEKSAYDALEQRLAVAEVWHKHWIAANKELSEYRNKCRELEAEVERLRTTEWAIEANREHDNWLRERKVTAIYEAALSEMSNWAIGATSKRAREALERAR